MNHFISNTLILLLITFSCNKKNDSLSNGYEEIKKTDIINNTKLQFNQDFYDFTQQFKSLNIPCEIKYKGSNWFDFSNSENIKEIDRELVEKYLFGGNNEKNIKQPDGGYRQFYYGYKTIFPNKNIGLIYYRTDEEYIGFCISIYNSKGDFIYDSFIAGSKGEYDTEIQIDAYISEQSIEIVKFFILGENSANEERIELDIKEKTILNSKKILNIPIKYNEETDRFEKVY